MASRIDDIINEKRQKNPELFNHTSAPEDELDVEEKSKLFIERLKKKGWNLTPEDEEQILNEALYPDREKSEAEIQKENAKDEAEKAKKITDAYVYAICTISGKDYCLDKEGNRYQKPKASDMSSMPSTGISAGSWFFTTKLMKDIGDKFELNDKKFIDDLKNYLKQEYMRENRISQNNSRYVSVSFKEKQYAAELDWYYELCKNRGEEPNSFYVDRYSESDKNRGTYKGLYINDFTKGNKEVYLVKEDGIDKKFMVGLADYAYKRDEFINVFDKALNEKNKDTRSFSNHLGSLLESAKSLHLEIIERKSFLKTPSPYFISLAEHAGIKRDAVEALLDKYFTSQNYLNDKNNYSTNRHIDRYLDALGERRKERNRENLEKDISKVNSSAPKAETIEDLFGNKIREAINKSNSQNPDSDKIELPRHKFDMLVENESFNRFMNRDKDLEAGLGFLEIIEKFKSEVEQEYLTKYKIKESTRRESQPPIFSHDTYNDYGNDEEEQISKVQKTLKIARADLRDSIQSHFEKLTDEFKNDLDFAVLFNLKLHFARNNKSNDKIIIGERDYAETLKKLPKVKDAIQQRLPAFIEAYKDDLEYYYNAVQKDSKAAKLHMLEVANIAINKTEKDLKTISPEFAKKFLTEISELHSQIYNYVKENQKSTDELISVAMLGVVVIALDFSCLNQKSLPIVVVKIIKHHL